MHGFPEYANVCLWPKADIETESKSAFLNVCFGEKSGHSALNPCGAISLVVVGSNYTDKAKPA